MSIAKLIYRVKDRGLTVECSTCSTRVLYGILPNFCCNCGARLQSFDCSAVSEIAVPDLTSLIFRIIAGFNDGLCGHSLGLPQRDPRSVLTHLRREAAECITAMDIADALMRSKDRIQCHHHRFTQECGECDEQRRQKLLALVSAEAEVLVEFADQLILLFAAIHSRGFSLDRVLDAALAKMQKNLLRRWNPPDSQGVIEHNREAGD